MPSNPYQHPCIAQQNERVEEGSLVTSLFLIHRINRIKVCMMIKELIIWNALASPIQKTGSLTP